MLIQDSKLCQPDHYVLGISVVPEPLPEASYFQPFTMTLTIHIRTRNTDISNFSSEIISEYEQGGAMSDA